MYPITFNEAQLVYSLVEARLIANKQTISSTLPEFYTVEFNISSISDPFPIPESTSFTPSSTSIKTSVYYTAIPTTKTETNVFAIGDASGQIKVYNALNLFNIVSFQAHTNTIWRIKQSPFNNDHVATCSIDTHVKIWNPMANWSLIRNYTGHSNDVYALDYINEDTIVSGSMDKTIQIWSISNGITNRTISVNDNVLSLKMLSNGFSLACGTSNGPILIYNINTGGLISTLIGHLSNINDLVLISNSLLASSSDDNTIRIWDLATNLKKFITTGHTSRVYGLKLISSEIILSGSYDKTIQLLSITSGQVLRTFSNHTASIYMSVDLLNDGKTVVSGSFDQTLKLWDWETGLLVNTLNVGVKIYSLTIVKF